MNCETPCAPCGEKECWADPIGPGVHLDLSNEAYHGDREYLSSSYLKTLLPEHYTPFTGDGSALDVGTAFHTLALGTDEEFAVVDAATWRGKAAEEKRAEARAAGKVPLLVSELAMVESMVASLRLHDDAMTLLKQDRARAEASCFATDPEGVRVKARFDLLAPVAVDLKSTSANPLSEYDLTKAIVNYGYELSAAHYLEVADLLDLGVEEFALVFVGKRAPHRVRVVTFSDDFLARGRALVALAKHRHAHPESVGPHPGAAGFITLNPPRWATVPEEIPA